MYSLNLFFIQRVIYSKITYWLLNENIKASTACTSLNYSKVNLGLSSHHVIDTSIKLIKTSLPCTKFSNSLRRTKGLIWVALLAANVGVKI